MIDAHSPDQCVRGKREIRHFVGLLGDYLRMAIQREDRNRDRLPQVR